MVGTAVGDGGGARVEEFAVTVIGRDRSNAYAPAGRLGAPGARQVCDRFHLVKNLGVERAVHRLYGQIRPALEGFANANRPVPAAPPPRVRRPTKAENARRETQARRQDPYDAIHAYRVQGMSIRTIARTLGLERRTVRKYANASQCPSPKWRRRANELDPFRPYLADLPIRNLDRLAWTYEVGQSPKDPARP
jgi:hypothetical protein